MCQVKLDISPYKLQMICRTLSWRQRYKGRALQMQAHFITEMINIEIGTSIKKFLSNW